MHVHFSRTSGGVPRQRQTGREAGTQSHGSRVSEIARLPKGIFISTVRRFLVLDGAPLMRAFVKQSHRLGMQPRRRRRQDAPSKIKGDPLRRVRGTQAEFLDKGKPVARPGRKAMGLARARSPGCRKESSGASLRTSCLRRPTNEGDDVCEVPSERRCKTPRSFRRPNC